MSLTERERRTIERSYKRKMSNLSTINGDDYKTRIAMARQVSQLMRIERKLRELAEHSCNGYPKEVTEHRDGKFYRYNVEDLKWKEAAEKSEARLEAKAREIGKRWGFRLQFQGDPRGIVIKLDLNPEVQTDDWGSDTDLIA
jgi:hypothetical protein